MNTIVALIFIAISASALATDSDGKAPIDTGVHGYVHNLGIVRKCNDLFRFHRGFITQTVDFYRVPNCRAFRCWLACILEETKLMESGELIWVNIINIMKSGSYEYAQYPLGKKIESIADSCQKEVSRSGSKDKCGTAALAATCVFELVRKSGFGKPNWDNFLQGYKTSLQDNIKESAAVEDSIQKPENLSGTPTRFTHTMVLDKPY